MVIGVFVPGRNRSGLTLTLPYQSSDGRFGPSGWVIRRVGAWGKAVTETITTARAAAANFSIMLLLTRQKQSRLPFKTQRKLSSPLIHAAGRDVEPKRSSVEPSA